MPISYKNLGSSKIQKIDVIKSTQSWTAPADVTSIEVILCGGGGAGIYDYGGNGSALWSTLTVTPSSSHTITIGGGGAKGGTPTAGTASSFGVLLTCAGGSAGNSVPSRANLGGNGGGPIYRMQTSWSGTDSGIISQQIAPGTGFNGFGGGGGGVAYFASSSGNSTSGPATPGAAGGGNGGTPSWNWNGSGFPASVGTAAGDGLANFGGGGGAGYATSTSTYGGNGGSGVAVIKYWSAL